MQLVLEMRSAVRCAQCSSLNPLPGLRSSTTCFNCGTAIDVIAMHQEYRAGDYYDVVGGMKLHDKPDGEKVPTSKLRKDRESAVRTMARVNPAFKPSFFAKLFGA